MQWFHGQVDSDWTVVVLTDRGLYARWLFQAIVDLGWYPMMRITHRNRFLPEGWVHHRPVRWFAPQVGRQWLGRGVAFPTTAESRLACTLLACWSEGHDDGWYLITRPGAPGGRGGLVWVADVDRARLRAVQVGGLAVAEDLADRLNGTEPAGSGWRWRWRRDGWSRWEEQESAGRGPIETMPALEVGGRGDRAGVGRQAAAEPGGRTVGEPGFATSGQRAAQGSGGRAGGAGHGTWGGAGLLVSGTLASNASRYSGGTS